MPSSSISAWLSQFWSLQRYVHNRLINAYYLLLVVFLGVTGWGDNRCINLKADTGQDLSTTRLCKPRMVPDRYVCQLEAGQPPNKAKVEASPKTRRKQFDYPLRQTSSREGFLEGDGVAYGDNGSNEHFSLTDGRFSATAGAAHSMCWCHSFKYIHVFSKVWPHSLWNSEEYQWILLGCKVVNIQQIRGPSWYIQHSISEYTLKMLSHQLLADQLTGSMCSELASRQWMWPWYDWKLYLTGLLCVRW